MSVAVPDPTPVNDALRRLHRSALLGILICAVALGIMLFGGTGDSSEQVDQRYTYAALALAAVAILARRTSTRGDEKLRTFVYGSISSLMAAMGLGLLGIAIGMREGQTSTGLLYTLAGAVLLLRPPPRLVAPKRESAQAS